MEVRTTGLDSSSLRQLRQNVKLTCISHMARISLNERLKSVIYYEPNLVDKIISLIPPK